jgi:hypothetical protein
MLAIVFYVTSSFLATLNIPWKLLWRIFLSYPSRFCMIMSRPEPITESDLPCGVFSILFRRLDLTLFPSYYKMLRFKSLADLVLHRNISRGFLPGVERSDSILRLNRHRLARSADITAKTSSLDRNDLGVNKRWNAGNFNSCNMALATTQYPQSSTVYESNCNFFLL